jgi:hypothetical protein
MLDTTTVAVVARAAIPFVNAGSHHRYRPSALDLRAHIDDGTRAESRDDLTAPDFSDFHCHENSP